MTDDPYGRDINADDPFDAAAVQFGPVDHTLAARQVLAAHLSPIPSGGLTEFAGAPVALCLEAALYCHNAQGAALIYLANNAVDINVGVVTLSGHFVDPDRADERLEFTSIHVAIDVGDMPAAHLVAHTLSSRGLECMLERAPDNWRIRAVLPAVH